MPTKTKRDTSSDRENQRAHRDLRKAIHAGRMLAFVGAGVSRRCGYPDWKGLLQILHDTTKKSARGKPGKWTQRLDLTLSTEEDLLWRAEEYRRLLESRRYANVIKSTFSPKKARPDALLKRLVDLPFGHVLTTNFDTLLERADNGRAASREAVVWSDGSGVDDGRAAREVIGSLADADYPRRYVHLHGIYSDIDSVVLTDSDFARRYARSDETRKKIFSILATQRVVFIGYGINDPDLQAILREVNANVGGGDSRHFAIMPLEHGQNPGLIRRRLCHKYGIEPVFYPVTRKQSHGATDHSALDSVVKGLKNSRVGLPSIRPEVLRPKGQPVRRDPDDPQRGMWGGKFRKDGRALSATVKALDEDWYELRLRVTADLEHPLTKPVKFHLHDTFVPSVMDADKQSRKVATLALECYGAFTVGVQVPGGPGGETHLELDLSTLRNAPQGFLKN